MYLNVRNRRAGNHIYQQLSFTMGVSLEYDNALSTYLIRDTGSSDHSAAKYSSTCHGP